MKKDFFETLFHQNPSLQFSFGTSGAKKDAFAQNLHRIAMENGFSAKEEIEFESNYYQLKAFLNKNTVSRS